MNRRDRIARVVIGACYCTLGVWVLVMARVLYLMATIGLDDLTTWWLGVSIPLAFGPIIIARVAIEYLDGGLFNRCAIPRQ